MTSEIISQQVMLWDGFNLTTRVSRFVIDFSTDAVENTTLGDDTKSNAPGLYEPGIQIEGHYDDTVYDESLANTYGGNNKLISILRRSANGSLAWFLNAMHATYEPVRASTGELAGFSAGGKASKTSSERSTLVRGQVLGYATDMTATGYSPTVELGAVSSTQRLYAGLHVWAIDDNAGDTLNVTIQSDDNSGFTSHTDRIVFSQMDDIGSQFKSLAGPVTDTYYRSLNAVAGSTPAFAAAILIGVQ